MSFRRRLTLFFVLIVIVPMLAVSVVLFRLIADNETGKADARVAQGQRVAIALYREAVAAADGAAREVGGDEALARALRAGDRARAAARAERLLRAAAASRAVVVARGRVLVDVGARDALAPARRTLVGAAAGRIGVLEVATRRAPGYAGEVRRLTGLDVIVRAGERTLASTVPGDVSGISLPRVGDATVGRERRRVASFSAPGIGRQGVRIAVLGSAEATASSIADNRLLAAGVLAGFFILAFGFAIAVSRSLQAQIADFLHAARRIGAGDFSTRVPISGRDEFAELGGEFNKMSEQLRARLEELRRERARLEGALRRVGETFASNLDRGALVEIVVRTAVEGVGASGGRATLRAAAGEPLTEVARAGDLEGLAEALRRVEAAALASAQPEAFEDGDASALGFPLRASAEEPHVVGLVSVARRGGRFTDSDRELFHYLAGQAAVSIENVDLHEAVQRQAVTDELTGLFNHRRFQEVIGREVERAKRFGDDLGLIMLDIDNFKSVNDTYGHPQGDEVLRAVARVLRETSREIDEPARYGGEEMAVALPQTDLAGAYNFAERVRERIEALDLPRLDGGGRLRITASFGVAAIPGCPPDKDALIAAADAALYEAKRAGKNRTVQAG